jgi:hypothetical protein
MFRRKVLLPSSGLKIIKAKIQPAACVMLDAAFLMVDFRP